jgi:hypothetical protein
MSTSQWCGIVSEKWGRRRCLRLNILTRDCSTASTTDDTLTARHNTVVILSIRWPRLLQLRNFIPSSAPTSTTPSTDIMCLTFLPNTYTLSSQKTISLHTPMAQTQSHGSKRRRLNDAVSPSQPCSSSGDFGSQRRNNGEIFSILNDSPDPCAEHPAQIAMQPVCFGMVSAQERGRRVKIVARHGTNLQLSAVIYR